MKMRTTITAIVALGWIFSTNITAEEKPQTIQSSRDLVSSWRPEQHVYIKGNLGLSKERLGQLESWLDENGKHWTVALLSDSQGESYRAADGRDYFGMDAVEYALGHGLSNRTSFGEFTDGRTGESDGCVFVMFLTERKFSYFGSDAQDRRGLGESRWIGELDRPAFRAMRGGGRIIDAVKDTVTSINSRLQKAIDSEEQEKAAEMRRRQKSVLELQSRLAVIGNEITKVAADSKALRTSFAAAKGDLTKPPIEEWRSELTQLQNAVTEENVYAIGREATSLSDRVSEYLNAFLAGDGLSERLQELNGQVAELRANELASVAESQLDEAALQIGAAEEQWQEGRFDFRSRLAKADRAIESAKKTIAEEAAQLEKSRARRKLIVNTAAGTGLVGLCCLGGLGYSMNRRRVPVRDEARKVLADKRKTVSAEVEKVFGLFERSNEILGGSRERLKERGYEGKTRELGERTFDNVDDLIVMSSEVERVMDEADELIEPSSPIGKIINVFSGSRYQRGIDRVSGKPLEFKRDKGLPLALDDEAIAAATGPDGELSPSIQLTFEDVFERFHDRTNRAGQTLNKIEQSFLELNDGLTELQAEIDSATLLEQKVTRLAEENEYFSVPAFFEKLLPSAQADSDQADSVAVNDPVLAVHELIPSGKRKIREATQLAETLQRGHAELLPMLRGMAPKLEDEGYETEWIDVRLEELTEQADQLFAEAAQQEVGDACQQFDDALSGLGVRAERSLDLAHLLQDELVQTVDHLENSIQQGRREISERLGLDAERMLREQPHDPDVNLNSGRLMVEGVRAALHHGNVDAASEAVAVLRRDVGAGEKIVSDSIDALHRFDDTHRDRTDAVGAVRGQLNEYELKVDDARRRYSRETLAFRTADESYPEDDATLESHLGECHGRLDEVDRFLGLSRDYFQQGRVLEASAIMDTVAGEVAEIQRSYSEMDEHLRKVDAQERSNKDALEAMVARIDSLKSRVQDHRSTDATMDQFRVSVENVQQVAREVESQEAAREPFRVSMRIESLSGELDELDALIESDRRAHAEAGRAVESAQSQAVTAQRLKQRANRDGIPDSGTTTSLVRSIDELRDGLQGVRRKLQGQHLDWKSVHEEAIVIHRQLDEAAGQLRGELQIAEQAAMAVENASRDVFQAAQWTGGWGVRIFGSPGSRQLDRARDALQRADYGSAINLSRGATIEATQAIAKAQREVARREREKARKAEEARRRRRQSSISIGGGGSGSRIGTPRRSGRISSSGRRSKSSTSGFKRSGW